MSQDGVCNLEGESCKEFDILNEPSLYLEDFYCEEEDEKEA